MSEHETLISLNAGRNYNDIRDQIASMDWDAMYPEVDIDGCLTGRVVSIESTDHLICDVRETGVVFGNGAMDAMIEMTPEQAIYEAVCGDADINIVDEDGE